MNIRPASFRDLPRVEQIFQRALQSGEATGPLSSQSTLPQARALVRLWYGISKTVTSLVPLAEAGDLLFVAEHPSEGVVGFVQATVLSSRPAAWQIVNLCSSATAIGRVATRQLLDGLLEAGGSAGLQRLFVRVPLDHPLTAAFLEAGFCQYATEQILFCEEPRPAGAGIPLRAMRRDDLASLHRLYQRTTPASVAALEATTRKHWQATFAEGILSRKDARRHMVASEGDIIGWAAVTPPTALHPTQVTMLCESQDPLRREHFVDSVLAELPPAPASCVLRHYDSELIRSLQSRGFAIYGTQVLLARDVSVRLRLRNARSARQKKSLLAPAGLARSVPNHPPVVRFAAVMPVAAPQRVGRSER